MSHTINGGQIGFNCLIMGNDVYAPRKTRDDNWIELPQTSAQFTTNLFPIKIARSGTNDAEELTLTKIEVSLVKQNQGRIGSKSKCFEIIVITQNKV